MSQKRHIMQRPWFAVLWFLLVLVVFIFAAFPLQMRFGMMGLAMTQVIILILALIPLIISKQKLKDVFPIKFSGIGHLIRQIIGTIFMWVGTYVLVLTTNVILMFFFPDAFSQVSEALGDIFYSVPFVVGIIIVAVFPAVCEEALHRGYILFTMRDIKSEALVVFIMAVIFGVFHLDPVRFIPTAILGATITYIMIKTKNILMPVLLHFLNNAISFLIGTIDIPQDQLAGNSEATFNAVEHLGGQAIGAMITLTFFVPFFIVGGAALLRPKVKKSQDEEAYRAWKKRKIRMAVYAALTSAALLMTGFIIMFVSTLLSPPFLMNKDIQMTQADGVEEVIFVAGQSRTYMMDYEFKADKGQIYVVIIDENDQVYFDVVAADIFGDYNLKLEAGEYRIRFQIVPQDVEAFYDEIGYEIYDQLEEYLVDSPENEYDLVNVKIKMTII